MRSAHTIRKMLSDRRLNRNWISYITTYRRIRLVSLNMHWQCALRGHRCRRVGCVNIELVRAAARTRAYGHFLHIHVGGDVVGLWRTRSYALPLLLSKRWPHVKRGCCCCCSVCAFSIFSLSTQQSPLNVWMQCIRTNDEALGENSRSSCYRMDMEYSVTQQPTFLMCTQPR